MKKLKEKSAQYQRKRQKKSVQELLGIARITEYGLWRTDGVGLIIFLLEPDNLSVLSEAGVAQKVYGLMMVLKGLTELELCCVNSKENFSENKRYLKKRMAEEKNARVQNLLRADLEMLEAMEQEDSGAREFLVIIRIKAEEARELGHILSRVEKAFREQAIRVKRVDEQDLKRILSVYFSQLRAGESLEDYDGERWVTFYEDTKEI